MSEADMGGYDQMEAEPEAFAAAPRDAAAAPQDSGSPFDVVADLVHGAVNFAESVPGMVSHLLDDAPFYNKGEHDGLAGQVDRNMLHETPEHERAYIEGWKEGNDERPHLDHLVVHGVPDSPGQAHMGPNTMTPADEERGREIQESRDELRRVLTGRGEGPEQHTDPEPPKIVNPPEPPVGD